MARKSETLELVIRAKETASKDIKKLNKAFSVTRKRITSLRKTVLNLKSAFAGLAIGYMVKNLVSASNEQAKAVKGLNTALKSMGRYTPELSKNLQDVASALQGVTNFGDEATIAGQKFLVTYRGITDDLLPRSTKAMLDLGALMGGDTTQAANLLGKASRGMTGELIRSGITVDANVYKTQGYLGVLKAIESQSRGQAEAMRRATGPWIAIGMAIGDVKEKLGDMLKLTFGRFGDDLLDVIDQIDAKIKQFKKSADFKDWVENTRDRIQRFLEDTLMNVAVFYDAIQPILHNIKVVLSSIWDTFKEMPDWAKEVGLVVAILGGKKVAGAIAGLLWGISEVKTHLKIFKALLDKKISWKDFLAWQNFQITTDQILAQIDQVEQRVGHFFRGKIIMPVKDFWKEFSAAKTAAEKVRILTQYLRQLREERAKQAAGAEAPAAPAPPVPTATDAAKTKSHLARLIASTKTALLILANTYKDGEVSLQQYFDRRRELIETQYAEEIAAMKAAAAAEPDPSKKLVIEDRIFAKEEEHKRTLIDLTRQQIEVEAALAQKKIEIDQAMADLRQRAESEKGGGLLQAGFDKELAEMDARHVEELQGFKDMLDNKLAAETGYMDEAAALRDVQRMQQLEKEKLLADQERRIWDAKLENAQTVAGGMADIFDNLYELTGKKHKEFFYLAKAAALAEAIMNTAQGVTKALAQGGIMGPVMAAVVAAAGAVQIATITAQKLAAGGKIRGSSPSDTADNVPIMATAGEYVQPVKTVQYYGSRVMEAMRKRMIPKELFAGLTLPDFTIPRPMYAFAAGGQIPAQPAAHRPEGRDGDINIINVTDPRDLDSYLATAAGENAILNVLSSRASAVRRILR
ncbi:MAG: hypothetical protein JRC60_00225 [Deltaproteobacteria bacterium]|nr:hypothetical protein [Deltaproteobacteria bacterium]